MTPRERLLWRWLGFAGQCLAAGALLGAWVYLLAWELLRSR